LTSDQDRQQRRRYDPLFAHAQMIPAQERNPGGYL